MLSSWGVYHSSDGIWILYPFIGKNIVEYTRNPDITAAKKESVVRQLIKEIEECHKKFGMHFGTSLDNVVVNDVGFVVLAGFGSSMFFMHAPSDKDDDKDDENKENKNMDKGDEEDEDTEDGEDEDMEDGEDEDTEEDDDEDTEDEDDEEMKDGEDEDMKDGEYEAMEDGEDEDTEDDGDEAMEDEENEDTEDEENEMDSYFASLRPSAWKLMHEDWEGCVNIINAIIQGCTTDPRLHRTLSEVRDKIEKLLSDAKNSYPKVSTSSLYELELFKNNIDDRNMGIPNEELPHEPYYYIFGNREGKNFSIKQASLTGSRRDLKIFENPINPM